MPKYQGVEIQVLKPGPRPRPLKKGEKVSACKSAVIRGAIIASEVSSPKQGYFTPQFTDEGVELDGFGLSSSVESFRQGVRQKGALASTGHKGRILNNQGRISTSPVGLQTFSAEAVREPLGLFIQQSTNRARELYNTRESDPTWEAVQEARTLAETHEIRRVTYRGKGATKTFLVFPDGTRVRTH